MHYYVEAGITDDFSMAFADAPGFRLGTTRPSRAINPATGEVLPLVMHPLTIMDTTLYDERYLGLNNESAIQLCQSLIKTTKQYNGDVTLLFHNNLFNKELYTAILDLLD